MGAISDLQIVKHKLYAGIGSRKTPEDILALMEYLAKRLSAENYMLRSGGADGADRAFKNGAAGYSVIYLPWNGYNNYSRFDRGYIVLDQDNEAAYMKLCEKLHPNWKACSWGARRLHARNAGIIFGQFSNNKRPVEFVLCWTPGAKDVGGTAMGIRIAREFDIPVFNLADDVYKSEKPANVFEAIMGTLANEYLV